MIMFLWVQISKWKQFKELIIKLMFYTSLLLKIGEGNQTIHLDRTCNM